MSKTNLGQEYHYEKIVEFWSSCDHWTLTDAFRLLAELPPTVINNEPLDENESKGLTMWIEVAKNCAGKSLSTIVSSPGDNEYRVEPIEFLRWAQSRSFPIPEALQEAVEHAHNRVVGKVDKKLRNSQRRREKCRGIASLLWETHPTMSIKDMAERPEIFNHGCEKHQYARETVEDWIRKLCPEAKVGRPKKE